MPVARQARLAGGGIPHFHSKQKSTKHQVCNSIDVSE